MHGDCILNTYLTLSQLRIAEWRIGWQWIKYVQDNASLRKHKATQRLFIKTDVTLWQMNLPTMIVCLGENDIVWRVNFAHAKQVGIHHSFAKEHIKPVKLLHRFKFCDSKFIYVKLQFSFATFGNFAIPK